MGIELYEFAQTTWFQANLVWWDGGETTLDLNKMIYSSKTWLCHNFKRTLTRRFEQSLVQNTLGSPLKRLLEGLPIRNGQNCSHFTFSQKSESHHRSCSNFATPMMVLYRKRANDLGTQWPTWNTNLARNHCEGITRKGLTFLATLIERPPLRNKYRVE